MSYQKITVVGNAGGNADMRYLPDGTPVVNVSIAVNEQISNKDTTTWFRVAFWGNLTNAAMHIVKGQIIAVDGRIMVEMWEDRGGNTQAGLKINASAMRFIGGRPEGSKPMDNGTPRTLAEEVDDIPF